MPSSLKKILKHVQQSVSENYPNAKYKAIGAFLFLRFICPSLVKFKKFLHCIIFYNRYLLMFMEF